MKVFTPVFSINIANKPKRIKSTGTTISRKCFAVVKIIEGEFKAIINIDKHSIRIKEGDELSNEQIVLPFTEQSLSLRNKIYVWLKQKDKYNHDVCIIRDSDKAANSPGIPEQYVPLKDNLLIVGHIIRRNGIMYFDYEDIVAFHYLAQSKINNISVDDSKPLFNK